MSDSHATDIELIEWAAGQLPVSRHIELERHAASCPACRARFAAQRSIYEALGDWSPAQPQADLWPALSRRLDEPASSIPARRWHRLQTISRIAASVILGLGTGHVLSRLSAAGSASVPNAAVVTDDEALDALGVTSLAAPTATGLDTVLLVVLDEREGDAP